MNVTTNDSNDRQIDTSWIEVCDISNWSEVITSEVITVESIFPPGEERDENPKPDPADQAE
jgi:hypothetical protein